MKKNYEFYSKIDKGAEFVYKNNRYYSLKDFNPDIIFYEQQWGLPRIYKPYFVSFYALTYFCCYGIQMFDFKEDYTKTFHYFLYKYFVDFKENLSRFEKYNKKFINNCKVTGYPKSDKYFDIISSKNERLNVIYAPHHSINSGLNTATIQYNGNYILDFAKNTKDKINWIFKPHPRLKKALVEKKIMDFEKVNERSCRNIFRENEIAVIHAFDASIG